MDIYSSILDYLLDLPVLRDWTAAQALLKKAASVQPRDWPLPILACEAVGGTAEQAIPASAALACAQTAIILIDDMLDDDPRGEYHLIGEAQVANFAVSFLSAGSEAILWSKARPELKLATTQSLNRMILTVALGQHLDSQNPAGVEAYWRVVETKSASFFGTALHLGALLGGASDDTAKRLEQLGQLYGEMIQIHDDLNDTMAVPANPDWIQGRSPLPILFAQLVEHSERLRFLGLRQDVSDPEALREAQNILIRCGAVSYCMDQLLRRHHAAQEVLKTTALIQRDGVERLLKDVIAPVRKLFEAVGEPLPVQTIWKDSEGSA